MDLLRTCYRHRVYWDDAKTRSSQIIWYRAADDALWFPHPHVFSSERYDTVHWWNDGAGEDELTGPTYSKGAPPGPFLGQSFCGPAEWYLGAPSNAPPLARDLFGLPACCFGSEPSGISVLCGTCTILPAVWRLIIPGDVVDHGCTGCGQIAGLNLDLVHVPAGDPLPFHDGVSNGCNWVGEFATKLTCPFGQTWLSLSGGV